MEVRITEKGRAFLKAIECGLIPEKDGEYDSDAFSNFWEWHYERLCKRFFRKSMIMSILALIISVIVLLIK